MGLFERKVTWSLVSMDTGSRLDGQFEPQNLVQSVAGVWASEGTLGLDSPILRFVRGQQESINCDVKIWAKHHGLFGLGRGDNISATRDAILALARKDPDLGRPHIYLFNVGSEFSEQVIVQSVGGIRYDRMRPKDGSLRGVLFHLEMLKYVEYDTVSLIQNAAESLVIPAKQGDDFEKIAYRLYGDADLGEVLRRRNPSLRKIEAGDLIHIPPANKVRSELDLTPASLFLKTGDRQSSVYSDVVALRSRPKVSHVLDGSKHGARASTSSIAKKYPGSLLIVDARYNVRTGTTVTSLIDQSGQGNNVDVVFSTGIGPTYVTAENGGPAIQFDAGKLLRTTKANFQLGDSTVLAIFEDNLQLGGRLFSQASAAASSAFISSTLTNLWTAGIRTSSPMYVNVMNKTGIVGYRRGGSQRDLIATWAISEGINPNGIIASNVDTNVSPTDSSAIAFGGLLAGSNKANGVRLKWFGLWNRALTNVEILGIYNDLKSKYGLS